VRSGNDNISTELGIVGRLHVNSSGVDRQAAVIKYRCDTTFQHEHNFEMLLTFPNTSTWSHFQTDFLFMSYCTV